MPWLYGHRPEWMQDLTRFSKFDSSDIFTQTFHFQEQLPYWRLIFRHDQLCHAVEPVLATTWQKRPPENYGHTISVPSICGFKCTGVTAFLKMRPPEKCELQTSKVGPKRQFNLRKATTCVKISEKHFFWLSNFSFVGTPNEWSSCLQAPLGVVIANGPIPG